MTQPPPSVPKSAGLWWGLGICISHKLPGNVDAPGLSSIFENPQALDNKGFGASKIWLLKTMIHEILKKVDRSGHFEKWLYSYEDLQWVGTVGPRNVN